MKRIFVFAHQQARDLAAHLCRNAPAGYVCTIQEPTRSISQNSAQWPILQAFSDQLEWPVNGAFTKLTPDEWKDLLTAAFKKSTVRVAQGLDGGMVLLGFRTSKFSKREFSDWLEFLHATAADRGVTVYEDMAA